MSVYAKLSGLVARVFASTPIVACGLTKADLGSQLQGWQLLWAEAGIERAKTDAGVRLLFRDEPLVESELRRLVTVENECCSWAKWVVSREDEALSVRVGSSGAGTIALHAMFDAGPLSFTSRPETKKDGLDTRVLRQP